MLMYASFHFEPEVFAKLLELGADPTWINSHGSTVLTFCAKRGQLDMAKKSLEYVPEEKKQAYINHGSEIGN